MKDKATLLAICALILGVAIGYLVGVQRSAQLEKTETPLVMDMNSHQMADGTTMSNTTMNMGDTMGSMMSGLAGKTGDAFDKAFLEEMIVHHEGAVDMAKAALADAKHDEIKKMGTDIINAQTKEISQMKEWLSTWYPETK
ncbi:MAG: DUF305 domain-containing protein [Patescibacteria group bacterium]